LIREAGMDRRSFLRSIGAGAASLTMGDLRGLAGAITGGSSKKLGIQALAQYYFGLPKKVQALANKFKFGLVNAHPYFSGSTPEMFLKEYVKNGVVHYKRSDSNTGELVLTSETADESGNPLPSFPVQAILGGLVGDSPEGTMGALLTGFQPRAYDLIQKGVVSDVIDFAIERHGIEGVISAITNLSDDIGMVNFHAWSVALTNPTLSKFVKMTPEMVKTAERTGAGLQRMVDNNMARKDYASDWFTKLKKQRLENEAKKERPKQEADYEEEEEGEEITTYPGGDQRLASGMYQPMDWYFEHKLQKALSKRELFEHVF
jgi:hypothetical protein